MNGVLQNNQRSTPKDTEKNLGGAPLQNKNAEKFGFFSK